MRTSFELHKTSHSMFWYTDTSDMYFIVINSTSVEKLNIVIWMDNRLTSMIEHIFFFYCKYTQHVSYVARELQQLLPRKVSNVMDIESRTPTICNYCSKLVNKHLLCRSSLQSNSSPIRMASRIYWIQSDWQVESGASNGQRRPVKPSHGECPIL